MISLAERVLVRSYTRPLRVAISIPASTSSVPFRRAVRALCSLWGGAGGIIVTGDRTQAIHETWLPLLRAHDPDVVFMHPTFASARSRASTEIFLTRHGLSPFWVAKLADDLQPESGWRLLSLAAAAPPGDTGGETAPAADELASPSPVEVAALGLLGRSEEPATPRLAGAVDRARLVRSGAIHPGTPLAQAAADIPGFRYRPTILAPFLYYEQPNTAAAIWVWNARATRGAIWHGDEEALSDYLDRAARLPAPRQILCVDPLPIAIESRLKSVRGLRTVRPISINAWEVLSLRRQPVDGFDVEIDELPVRDGIVSLPKRAPRTGATGSPAELIAADGAHAIEIEVQALGVSERPMSLPPHDRARDVVLNEGPSSQVRRVARSRARRRGQIALAVMPSRWPRAIPLALRGFGPLLQALDPASTYRLSDKGHYGRWVLASAGGLESLHSLLTDHRARIVFREFQAHHAERQDSTGAYRRFLTVSAIRAAFTSARRAGELKRRIAGEVPDTEWLEAWLSKSVAASLLRVGIWARCRVCLKGSFASFGSFGSTVTCPRCGSVAPTPGVPDVGYQLAEVVHQFFHNDCDISALAGAALSRRASIGFAFDFDHLAIEKKGAQREFDFAAVVDGGLAIGESKKLGQFDARDFDTLKRVARRLRPATVVLASGSSCEAGCTPKCVRDYTQRRGSSDSCLRAGSQNSLGARELLEQLRSDLAGLGSEVIVLCQGELYGPLGGRRATSEFDEVPATRSPRTRPARPVAVATGSREPVVPTTGRTTRDGSARQPRRPRRRLR